MGAGESTSLVFDFDHDLIDGWKYFCYLYYYSNGETVKKGTQSYYLNFPTEPQQPEYILGDVNDDGGVDIDDITMLIGVVLGSTPSTPHIVLAGDITHDTIIDIDDITALISQVLGS